jgi:hypothetical protein
MAALSRSARQAPRSPFSRPRPTGSNAADLAGKHPYYLFTFSRAGKTKIILGPVL